MVSYNKETQWLFEREIRQAVQAVFEERGIDIAPVLPAVLDYLKADQGVRDYMEESGQTFEMLIPTANQTGVAFQACADLASIEGGDSERYVHAVNLITGYALGANPMSIMFDPEGFVSMITRVAFGVVKLYPEILGLKEGEAAAD